MKLLLMIALICGLQIANAKDIELNTFNVCSLNDEVNTSTMASLKDCIADKVIKRRSKKYPIYVYLNSPGGSVYDGLRFIEFAKSVPNLHTITEFSASMAAAIAQGIPGKRYVTNKGIFMFHRASGGVRGQFEDGELESRLKLWKKIVREMEQMQADRIGINLEEYKKRRKDEWWLYGKENVDQKVSDGVVNVSCSHKLMSQRVKKTQTTLFGSFEYVESLCPLLN